MIIGIAGRKGSGKDTVAKFMLDTIGSHTAVIASFADPMKEMVQVLGIDRQALWGPSEEREKIVPAYGKTTRHILQTLGTEWGRELIDPDIWVTAMEKRYLALLERDPNMTLILPDVRFENEAALCRKYGTLVHITSNRSIEDTHVSEVPVAKVKGDWEIGNDLDRPLKVLEYYTKLTVEHIMRDVNEEEVTVSSKIEQIAEVAHEVNAAYCKATGDNSQVPWREAPDWQKESAINGVKFHLANDATPEESHNSWLAEKEADGWSWGPIKDIELKEHPCFKPYDLLPTEQKVKDYLFSSVVNTLATVLKD